MILRVEGAAMLNEGEDYQRLLNLQTKNLVAEEDFPVLLSQRVIYSYILRLIGKLTGLI